MHSHFRDRYDREMRYQTIMSKYYHNIICTWLYEISQYNNNYKTVYLIYRLDLQKQFLLKIKIVSLVHIRG